MKQPAIAVLGAGAIGAVAAEALSRVYGDHVYALADRERSSRYAKAGGIVINGSNAQFRFAAPDEAEPADLVIVAVKGYDLKRSLDLLEPLVMPHTQILSLLNGITSEAIIADHFGRKDIPLALTVGQDAVRRGYEITYTRKGMVLLGEHATPSLSPRTKQIRDLLVNGGIACEIPEDMLHELWWKFMVNLGVNQVSAVLKAPYGAFQQEGKARTLMLEAMEEVRMAALCEGVILSESDLQRWLSLLETLSPQGETSMLQDVLAGRPTEVELFSGTLLRLSETHRLDLPVNRKLYELLTGR